MVYNSISIENIIGRVLRNTRISDTSVIGDIYQWIPEAMELLETQAQIEKKFTDLVVVFHQVKSPCGMVVLDAIEYNGKRIMYSNTSSNFQARPRIIDGGIGTILQSTPLIVENPINNQEFLSTSLVQVTTLPVDKGNFYYTKLNYICTSMKEGWIRVFYQTPPLDENGFPMVPDNGNYKEALYWWVRGKLIGSGQMSDKANSEDSCLAKFEMYAARAIGEITYPSVDQMERIKANQLNFIIPENYWANHYN